MSGYIGEADSPIRFDLSGAHRPSGNPRLHTLSKPYSRPTSYSGPSNQTSNGHAHNHENDNDPSPHRHSSMTDKSNRSQLPSSHSSSSLPRSGSDSSLFSGLKSIFSRPLQWLATPSRLGATPGGTKRDSLSTFGQDLEDPGDSPTEKQERKRSRRLSPSRARGNGNYEPQPKTKTLEVEGRAVSGFMLPPLPPNLSLASRRQSNDKSLTSHTNFSRPFTLTNSKSMPYLDPPTNLFGSPSRKGIGSMSRSKRINLIGLGDEDDDMDSNIDELGKVKRQQGETEKEKDEWTPWLNKTTTPKKSVISRTKTPSRIPEAKDVWIPP